MKQTLKMLLKTAVDQWLKATGLSVPVDIHIERTRDASHGDFASNIAMLLAKPCGLAPRKIAEGIVQHFPANDIVARVDIAGPGFINVSMTPAMMQGVVKDILNQGKNYGRNNRGQGKRVLIEFVSSNPTGPLHVGHGRGAAYGAALADIMEAAGFNVDREYYVNDAGRQMKILTASIWLRYLALCGEEFTFPQNAYKGDYIISISSDLHREFGNRFHRLAKDIFRGIPEDFNEAANTGDKDAHIDGVIAKAEHMLGTDFDIIKEKGLKAILDDIKDDLAGFGVRFQRWFSEMELLQNGMVATTIEALKKKNYLYEKEGALWFRASDFGDEKDRVVMRGNGVYTYFATDLAYHVDKFERGYDHIIDIFGSDHHGYQARIGAVISALGYDITRFKVLLVQFAVLYRGGTKVQMSTRSGSFVTLRELREEVGNDAARFFYVLRKSEQHMDFDLDLAVAESNDNPMYYIQYAHARVCSVFRQMAEKNIQHDKNSGLDHLSLLTEPEEQQMLRTLSRYPETVDSAAANFEPHVVANYLRELANDFHVYYNVHQFLKAEPPLREARLNLISAVRQVLANGLHLLGVSAPEVM